eukprot:CAMPEP_0205817360 /NCGR_PEP_ID=MMETSP0205-20121125/24178_1 /ASSEMBLY_ACC=CAM_ASM_000278 /TAXON_ID=36767 /ORGANISM="Euplotes focardii, Strain TN1" /LENGTH=46 /DNA_ID= /DNA_START= /DNA_END= /DNA_ORIENTATION=
MGNDRYMELPLSEYQINPEKNSFIHKMHGIDDIHLAKGIQPNVNGK